MANTNHNRWDALDVLRGLTIMLMLLNISPGSWAHNYGFLVHAPWEGWTLIDIVAPSFLFCIGVAMPLSFERRSARGASNGDLMTHVMWRGLLLVAIGLFLNLYPHFDVATFRIPGVLQRIGLCYALCGLFMLLTARRDSGGITLQLKPLAILSAVILSSYWALLYFVPVPGAGAPGFDDPEWNWVSVIDRAVIGVEHFFPHWPVNGRVVFDPEGILSTWPACFNVLLGAMAGIVHARGLVARPAVAFVGAGVALMALAWLVSPICPIIKNIWTSSFALFSGGFTLVLLGLLAPVTRQPGVDQVLRPSRIFGENPLLAYILVFLAAPLIDAAWFGDETAPVTLRDGGQAWFEQWMSANAASLAFGLCSLAVLFAILLVCHRQRWILKL
jgi:predicted acyltransferase